MLTKPASLWYKLFPSLNKTPCFILKEGRVRTETISEPCHGATVNTNKPLAMMVYSTEHLSKT